MIRFVPLGGFLGAGKTTTMLAAGKALEAVGERVSVVTNDQGADLVDSQLAGSAGLAGQGEVTGGCFCCRFDDLATVVQNLQATVAPTVALAEAVGSCTDLQSTVVRPLRQLYGDALRVSPLTTVIDPRRYTALSRYFGAEHEPDLAYLYRHQLDEADLVAVNKIDLVAPEMVERVRADLEQRFPHARVVAYSAVRGDGLDDLIRLWTDYTSDPGHRPFAVDYDRYGAAEAELAWTNQTFTLTAAAPFSLVHWNEVFLREFAVACRETGSDIGHVKVSIAAPTGLAKASLVDVNTDPSHDSGPIHGNGGDLRTTTGQVTLNARVRTDPDTLSSIIDRATAAAARRVPISAGTRHGTIFRPDFPVPVHRM